MNKFMQISEDLMVNINMVSEIRTVLKSSNEPPETTITMGYGEIIIMSGYCEELFDEIDSMNKRMEIQNNIQQKINYLKSKLKKINCLSEIENEETKWYHIEFQDITSGVPDEWVKYLFKKYPVIGYLGHDANDIEMKNETYKLIINTFDEALDLVDECFLLLKNLNITDRVKVVLVGNSDIPDKHEVEKEIERLNNELLLTKEN